MATVREAAQAERADGGGRRDRARTVLVTGGAGFVGSHVCVALIEAGWRPVVLDDLSNSDACAMDRIAAIAGTAPRLVTGDVRDGGLLARLLRTERCVAVLHLAGLKSVAASMADPEVFDAVNAGGTRALLAALRGFDPAHDAGVRAVVFSSSATVYDASYAERLAEDAPLRPANPYGQSKLAAEVALRAHHAEQPARSVAILRYFNAAGAHPGGLLGERSRGEPQNLVPLVAEVAAGLRPRLRVHGGDYPTEDGTAVRDYVHVMDLAQAHVAALRHALRRPSHEVFNLGTGQGASVLQVVDAFAAASGRAIAYEIGPRRPGDVAAYLANPARARAVLGWQATRGLAAVCADAWRWQCGGGG